MKMPQKPQWCVINMKIIGTANLGFILYTIRNFANNVEWLLAIVYLVAVQQFVHNVLII